jgi:hypothetical protein
MHQKYVLKYTVYANSGEASLLLRYGKGGSRGCGPLIKVIGSASALPLITSHPLVVLALLPTLFISDMILV